ncbi:MAG: DUF4258 domain-containing protein [Anaerolineales bacterium]|nr:DUF4258 domain-containing protein [Anaerolineales bacterium]
MSELTPIQQFHLTSHALLEMERRRIRRETVERVLKNPGQIEIVRTGRAVYQALEEDGQHLIRVFVDIDQMPPAIVTVYRTSKIGKYWRQT